MHKNERLRLCIATKKACLYWQIETRVVEYDYEKTYGSKYGA